MPIYAYRCEACGFSKDVLQKMSDDPLTECPKCHAQTFQKQVTAAGFQLKGSGWYVTDFRNGQYSGSATTSAAAGGESGDGGDKPSIAKTSETAVSTAKAPATVESSAVASAPATAPVVASSSDKSAG